MSTLGEATANTTKGPFFTLFIPALDPNTWADRFGHLTQGLALVFVGLLSAKNPLIVTIPAMHGLVGGRKAFVTGRRADIFDLVQTGHFLLVEFRRGSRKNLESARRGNGIC